MLAIKRMAISAFLLFAASLSPAYAQTTLNVSTYAPYQHPLVSVALANWAKEVEKESGGKIKINILQTPLGQPQAHYDMAVNGIADITLGIPGYTPGRSRSWKLPLSQARATPLKRYPSRSGKPIRRRRRCKKSSIRSRFWDS